MSDIYTKTQRSKIMAGIRGTGNLATELKLISLLRQHGIRGWRRHLAISFLWKGKSFRTRPDFVFGKDKVVVFVDGEFWHGHPTRAKLPKANSAFWIAKISANKQRDRRVNQGLRSLGWKVIRIWQKDIAKPLTLRRILSALG